jgi:hypothetical protein
VAFLGSPSFRRRASQPRKASGCGDPRFDVCGSVDLDGDQFFLNGIVNQLGDIPERQLVHDIGSVGLHRLGRNSELVGDFSVFKPSRDEFKHLALSLGDVPKARNSEEDLFFTVFFFLHLR